jgi:hypothetical protein
MDVIDSVGDIFVRNLDLGQDVVPVGLVAVDGTGEVGDGSPGEVAKADIFLGSNKLFL